MVNNKRKKKSAQVTSKGYAHVTVTFNNTIVTITNLLKQTLFWSSAGAVGFKGSKKNTPFAAAEAARDCAKKAYKEGLREITVFIKGLGMTRESTIRALSSEGLRVNAIKDITPEPYNGCRAPKKRNP